MNFAVSGIGWITSEAFGTGNDLNRFSLKNNPIPEIDHKFFFKKPCLRFGRMDEFSKIGLAAIALALKDAGIDEWDQKRNIGIVAQTVYGCLSTDIRYYETVLTPESRPSPGIFTYTLPNCFLGEAAIYFGLTGPGFVICETGFPGISGLQTAADILIMGEAERMLVGICDLGRPEKVTTGEAIFPSAIFFLLEKFQNESRKPKKMITMDDSGRFFIYDNPLKGLLSILEYPASDSKSQN